jgi:hypothetical protein
MPDQRSSKERPSLPLTVPTGLVSSVRNGLYAELGMTAQSIDQAVSAAEHETHQERFRGRLARLDATRSLLDTIGWRTSDTPVPVTLDLREHHAALMSALNIALIDGEEDLREADAVDAERAKRGLLPKRKLTIRHLRALRELTAAVQAQAGALAREQSGR